MREIKFRVWDKIKKSYLHNDMLFLFANCTEYNIKGQSVSLPTGINMPYKDKEIKFDIIIEQFTGLKDKNGKEIYENDNIYSARYGFLATVMIGEYFDESLEENFIGWYVHNGENTYSLKRSFALESEIKGNIHENYENKELLK